MPSSTEVLASPPPRRRPVLRAAVTLVAVGLVAWALLARLSVGAPETPAAAPPPPAPRSSPRMVALGPPPWVRYPTPLEGRWVIDEASGQASSRLTLVIQNTYLDLWQGIGQQQGRPLTRRMMFVIGNRVHVHTPGAPGEVVTYRWRISGDRLSLELIDKTPKATAMLAGLTFHAD